MKNNTNIIDMEKQKLHKIASAPSMFLVSALRPMHDWCQTCFAALILSRSICFLQCICIFFGPTAVYLKGTRSNIMDVTSFNGPTWAGLAQMTNLMEILLLE